MNSMLLLQLTVHAAGGQQTQGGGIQVEPDQAAPRTGLHSVQCTTNGLLI